MCCGSTPLSHHRPQHFHSHFHTTTHTTFTPSATPLSGEWRNFNEKDYCVGRLGRAGRVDNRAPFISRSELLLVVHRHSERGSWELGGMHGAQCMVNAWYWFLCEESVSDSLIPCMVIYMNACHYNECMENLRRNSTIIMNAWHYNECMTKSRMTKKVPETHYYVGTHNKPWSVAAQKASLTSAERFGPDGRTNTKRTGEKRLTRNDRTILGHKRCRLPPPIHHDDEEEREETETLIYGVYGQQAGTERTDRPTPPIPAKLK